MAWINYHERLVKAGADWRSRCCASLRFVTLLFAVVAAAQYVCCASGLALETTNAPWQINADRITNYKEPEKIVAEGNVVLQRLGDKAAPMEIRGDSIVYDISNGTIDAEGNIVIRSKDEEIKADKAQLSLNKQTGTLTGASFYFKENSLYFTGRLVEKTGDQTYRVEGGWLSACKTEEGKSAPWAIASSEGRLTIDGFAVLKHATFRVKDFPILYSPLVVFPAKVTRQTGFLLPEFSHSTRDGLGFLEPFFVNLSPSSDVTLYAGFLEKKGALGGIEGRYVAGFASQGTLAASYLHDRTVDTVEDDFKSDNYLRDTHERYWLRGKVDHDFGLNLIGRLDLDVVSDRDFLQEYRDGMTGFRRSNQDFLEMYNRGLQEESIPFRESTIQLGKTWVNSFAGAETRVVDDVTDIQTTTSIQPSTENQALPRLLFQTRQQVPGLPLSLAWDSEYINYWRDAGIGGQRLDIDPWLISPLPLGHLFEGKMAAGFRQTFYRVDVYGDESLYPWADAKNKNRTISQFTGDVATMLRRDIGMVDPATPRFVHIFRPSIGYDYITAPDQTDLPDFDGDDRVASKNAVNYTLYNYFQAGSRRVNGASYIRDVGRLKISQDYNISEVRRTLEGPDDKHRPWSDIIVDLSLFPSAYVDFRYQTALSVYGKGVTSYDFLVRLKDKRGDSLSTDYRYVLDSVHQLNTAAQLKITEKLSVRGSVTRSLLADRTIESTAGLLYQPHCWGIELQYSDNSDDQRLMVLFLLEGVGRAFGWGKGNL